MKFSWTFPGFAILQICMSIGSKDSHRSPVRAAEVPIHFPCSSIAYYLICFQQLPHCRISTSSTPTQTWPRQAPPVGRPRRRRGPQERRQRARGTWPRRAAPAGTASAKEVHNSDDGECWQWQAPAARTGSLLPGTCRQRYCREARDRFAEATFQAEARFRFIITYFYIILR